MKRLTLIGFTILALLFALGGCAQEEKFAAKVNDKIIPYESFEKKLTAIKLYYKAQGLDLDKAENKVSLESVKSEVLESLITTELIHQETVKNNWDLSDPEVAKQVDNLKSQLNGADYQKWLEEQSMTESEVTEFYTFTQNISKDVTVSDQEIKQFFEANYSRYGGQDEQVKARHILVGTEQEALDIIEAVKGGKDFAELAKEKSTDEGSKANGGDLGYFTRGQMVAPFEEAAFSQEEGKVSEKPVQSNFGYHVILVEDHKQAVVPDFAKAKDSVTQDTLLYAKDQKIQSYFSTLRQNAKVEYAEDLKPEA